MKLGFIHATRSRDRRAGRCETLHRHEHRALQRLAQQALTRLAPPSEQEALADAVAGGNGPDHRTRLMRLGNKPHLVLNAPAAPPLPTSDDLHHAIHPHTSTTALSSSLRRQEAHTQTAPGGGIRAIDRDGIVVPEGDQSPELEVAGERDRLLADALHEATVTHEDVGEVVDQPIAELPVHDALAKRHADRLRDALAERARGQLDAVGVFVLGVARRLAADLSGSVSV